MTTLLVVLFVLVAAALLVAAGLSFVRRRLNRSLELSFDQPAEPTVGGREGCVVTYHPIARQVGERVLSSGGNAFDAFVAVAVAENVLAEGASTLAGPLVVMTYRAADGEVAFVDADFNDPLDHAARRPAGRRATPGQATLVPGAPAGLEHLARAYGTLPFARLLEPSIELSRDGFPVHRFMAAMIAHRAAALRSTPYGRATFFRGGKPLRRGDALRQPEVATFLTRLAEQGAAYVYAGDWGRRFVEFVRGDGGWLSERDLRAYEVKSRRPLTYGYHDCEVSSCSGRSYGGAWVAMALKTLEQGPPLSTSGHYSRDADALERMVRIARQVWSEPWLFDYRALDDVERVNARLTEAYAQSTWQRVRDRLGSAPAARPGTHSYQIVVIDRDGNVANGTTTIESQPFGAGAFLEGIALPTSATFPWHTAPGERRLSPFSMHLVRRDGKPRFAVGTISNSVVEASFQLLVNLIDYQLPIREAVVLPRFGTFPPKGRLDRFAMRTGENWLDPRVHQSLVRDLKTRGVDLRRTGVIDTGLGAIAEMCEGGVAEGLVLPVPYVSQPF